MDALNGALPLHGPVPEAFLEDQTMAAMSIPKHVWLAIMHGLLDAVPPIDRGTIGVAP